MEIFPGCTLQTVTHKQICIQQQQQSIYWPFIQDNSGQQVPQKNIH